MVRFPHAGTFEIPIVTVNNKNLSGRRNLGNVQDAIGINAKVAERLSGADFDGDTVVAIPKSSKVDIKSTPALKDLKDFDPKIAYAVPEGNPNGVRLMKKEEKQKEMGIIELGAFLAVSKFDKLGVLKGTGLILLASALNILQSAVAKFGSMNLNEIQNGLIAVGAALTEFAAFGIVAGFSKKMLASSASVLILSSSMVVLSRAMKSISGLDGESIKKSLIAIGGALAEFVLALNLTKGTLGSAASLTIMTVAINLLVPALTGLGNLSLAQIGTGLLAIAGA